MLAVLVLFATVLLRFTIIVTVVYLLLPHGHACPRCGEPLARVRHALLARLMPVVEHGWCLGCGWSAPVRRAGPMPPAGHAESQSRVIRRAARS